MGNVTRAALKAMVAVLFITVCESVPESSVRIKTNLTKQIASSESVSCFRPRSVNIDSLALKVAGWDSSVYRFIGGYNAFAWNLYGELKDSTSKNVLYSPFGVVTVLTMIYGNAVGQTRMQISHLLGYSADGGNVETTVRSLLQLYETIDNVGPQRLGFTNMITASIPPKSSRQVRDEINSWIKETTNSRAGEFPFINDLRIWLLHYNQAFCRVLLQDAFESDACRQMPFNRYTQPSVSVRMMRITGRFEYGEDSLMQILRLPFAGGTLALTVLLPRHEHFLYDIERLLTKKAGTLPYERVRRKVELYMPRFKLLSSNDVKGGLKRLGMKDAFDSTANIPGVTGRSDLSVYAVNNATMIEVVAGTGLIASAEEKVINGTVKSEDNEPPVIVYVNKPFLFQIVDLCTGTILFIGRVMDPTKTGE